MIGPGLRLAFSWLTVLPVRGPDQVDRVAGAAAIRCAPVAGAALGLAAAAAAWTGVALGLGAALAGLGAVAALALLTRGMHLDGLSDTADGLGSYAAPERAQQIMHSGAAGPFGVAATVFCVVGQALALGGLAADGRWAAVVTAVAAGRVAVVLACRTGTAPARPSGFGVLVAGTQPWPVALAWCAALTAASACTVPGRPWQGPLAVGVALALSAALGRHCRRRLGGVSGDVLGATVEVTTLVAAVGLLAAP